MRSGMALRRESAEKVSLRGGPGVGGARIGLAFGVFALEPELVFGAWDEGDGCGDDYVEDAVAAGGEQLGGEARSDEAGGADGEGELVGFFSREVCVRVRC